MTERYTHYHKSGTVTSKLEIVTEDDMPECASEFTRMYSDALRLGFEGEISAAADRAFEAMRDRDRAFRYRPCVLRAEYSSAAVGGGTVVSVSVSCMSGRRAVYARCERHLLKTSRGETFYAGRAPSERGRRKNAGAKAPSAREKTS